MSEQSTIPCGLCGRAFPRDALTRHHTRPRSEGGTSDDIELLCSPCHSMVHTTYTNGTLAGQYASLTQLRQAPELQKYIRWVRKQPTTRRPRHARRRKKL
jgi:5-methylcytosine-specific restriction protein A